MGEVVEGIREIVLLDYDPQVVAAVVVAVVAVVMALGVVVFFFVKIYNRIPSSHSSGNKKQQRTNRTRKERNKKKKNKTKQQPNQPTNINDQREDPLSPVRKRTENQRELY